MQVGVPRNSVPGAQGDGIGGGVASSKAVDDSEPSTLVLCTSKVASSIMLCKNSGG